MPSGGGDQVMDSGKSVAKALRIFTPGYSFILPGSNASHNNSYTIHAREMLKGEHEVPVQCRLANALNESNKRAS